MYRMTLDEDVHRHFFSALGEGLGWRALLKRAAIHKLSRVFLAPLVFCLTMIETRDRKKYLEGFLEVFMWKLKRPALIIRSNLWKTQRLGHLWRENAWKLPNFFVSRVGLTKIAIENIWIHLVSNRFGLNSIGWRIELWFKIMSDQIRWRASVFRVRVAGASLWILTAVVSLFTNTHWLLTVGIRRALGSTICRATRLRTKLLGVDGPVTRVLGESCRIFVVYLVVPAQFVATRPKAFWKLHAWRLSKLLGELRAESWIFHAPTEWFKVRTPRFYKWVWRPALKIRYFLVYHLVSRWRNT
jgi:hypothetical protein